jgi:hypothetical protein
LDDAITVERLHVDQNLVEQVTVVDHLPMKNGDFPLIWHDMAILLGAKSQEYDHFGCEHALAIKVIKGHIETSFKPPNIGEPCGNILTSLAHEHT